MSVSTDILAFLMRLGKKNTHTQTHRVHIYFGTQSLTLYLSKAASSLALRKQHWKVHFTLSSSIFR